ncbi:MAG: MBL fold metallo-hydrolase [Candidatus Thermoplasmatota archaeon]
MVYLTFHGGVDEIGGNKILLEDEDTRIFLDFGLGFSRRAEFFEEYLPPRTANGIGDFLEMGLLPDIPGVYRDDLIRHLGRKEEEVSIDAVVLSHAHADHANYISFLHKDIPVYCSSTCKAILEAVEEQSQRDIENEVINYKPRPLYRRDYNKPPVSREFKLYESGKRFHVGSLEIEPVHVDHSVPGSYGFIIYTSEGSIVYTGDLRLHGLYAEKSWDFLESAKASEPVAMITEGTRVNTGRTMESEHRVYEKAKNILSSSKDFSIVDFNFKDVDRFTTFYRITRELGKKLVISFKHACFLERYHKDKNVGTPDSVDDHIVLLKPKRLTGTYIDEDYSDAYIRKRLNYPNILTAEEIKEKPGEYIIVLNFWYFNILVDLRPRKGAYIHSLSEPFNEEMMISYKRMRNWLDHFTLKYIQAHCSGHICGYDLKNLIKSIKPRMLYPIHTEHPAFFNRFTDKVILVKEGKTYKL